MDVSTATAIPVPTTSEPNGPFQLTAKALEQVQSVIKAQGFEGYFLSVRVVPSGCSGFGYDLNLLKDARPGDKVWEQDGVKIATDAMSEQYLAGTTVDYVVSATGEGFKFNNPNAKSACGCGQSFST
jgi:iron-sulfur cluster assembly protein